MGQFEIVKYLSEVKDQLNMVDMYGNSALHYAAAAKRIEIFEYLTEERGMDIN